MAKFFIDSTTYPTVKNMTTGQRLSITLVGTVEQASNGINLSIDEMKVGKKGKMNTQEILIANRLDRIESKLPGQAVSM